MSVGGDGNFDRVKIEVPQVAKVSRVPRARDTRGTLYSCDTFIVMDRKTLARYLDLANHHPEATPEDIRRLCEDVKKYGFHAAFVNPCYVGLARGYLEDKGAVGTVVSFPYGQDAKDSKILSAISSVRDGADELDVSMNIGLFKGGSEDKVLDEARTIVESAKNIKKQTVVKFIVVPGLLTDEEVMRASYLVLESGADFVKLFSWGSLRGVTVKDVELVKKVVEGKIKIKVAGGIDTLQEAMGFINAGVDRLGTSQAVKIIEELANKQ